ncbi:hypothetical protein GC197_09410, partial [bacterium]|nr:hypothetical protein [bacterium]
MTAATLDQATDRRSPSGRLRSTMCATRVSFTWLGTRKSLTREQREQAAESFDAQGEFLSAGKKLLDTKNPRFKAVTSVRNRIRGFWTSMSLP